MYLMARGRALPRWAVLKIVSNRSSTNFCSVPCKTNSIAELEDTGHTEEMAGYTGEEFDSVCSKNIYSLSTFLLDIVKAKVVFAALREKVGKK